MSKPIIRLANHTDAAALGRISVASWRQTYRCIMPTSYLDALDPIEREARMRERIADIAVGAGAPLACAFVAEDADGEVIGFVFGGEPQPMRGGEPPTDYDAELYALYLAPGRERQGIGARLTHAAASYLRAAGARSLIIWALADNPNTAFYARLGGAIALEQTITIAGAQLREVAFVWSDIAALIAHTLPR